LVLLTLLATALVGGCAVADGSVPGKVAEQLGGSTPAAADSARSELGAAPGVDWLTARAEAEIRAEVDRWAAAWSRRDVDGYLSAYSEEEYRPASGDFQAWAQTRQARLDQARDLRLHLSGVEVAADGTDRAKVVFVQSYAARGYQDRVLKSLEMKHLGDRWKIVDEQIVRVLPDPE
jgi:ketosteroid isomerase-like protein